MANTLQIKRGTAASLPSLNQGELGYATDNDGIYVGDGVNNHRATMDGDIDLSGNGYFLNENDMASNSAVKVASQQSIKQYVDNSKRPQWRIVIGI
jgi:hypothetical protein